MKFAISSLVFFVLGGGTAMASNVRGGGSVATPNDENGAVVLDDNFEGGEEEQQHRNLAKTSELLIHPGYWGDWTHFETGGRRKFACGAQIRYEDNPGGGGDYSAANGLKLIFCDIDNWNDQVTKLINPGFWGQWKHHAKCPPDMYVNGASVRMEESQGGAKDDTALNGLKLNCVTKKDDHEQIVTVFAGDRGTWTGIKKVNGAYVSAAKMRIEPKQGSGDDSAWNGLKFQMRSPGGKDMKKACSLKKKVKITKFCVTGNDDHGSWGEHTLRLESEKYFPKKRSDCPDDGDDDWCYVREGGCMKIKDKAEWITVDAFQTLSAETTEVDNTRTDTYSRTLMAKEWYIPTCEPYVVRFSKNFRVESKESSCLTLSGKVNAGVEANGAKVGGEVGADYKRCSDWTQPAESYIWYVRVEPDEDTV